MALQNETHLRFYLHDTLSGPNPTAIQVAQAALTKTTSTLFGDVMVIDDPLTVGPDINSKLVGRAQGLYSSSGKDAVGLLMAMSLVFLDDKYNGSSIVVLGRNDAFSPVREMPVVGGSGVFRLASGYVQLKTYSFNMTTGDAVVEYNLFVAEK
ncbi:Dirigent protein [Rhynchospora pubera]|uniref:Dirigent protein n=1 Tax=Rhynchospora pubera TaxID=906938 RepID=A0AAV8DE66_9POAL|nr:Dirigent protein [Rhynchospora pubera]